MEHGSSDGTEPERGRGDGSEPGDASGTEAESVLLAEDVSKHYGDTVALDGVSVSIGAGEVFCLIGPNGAGKTSFVRALTGTTDHGGDVTVFDSPPTEVDRSRVGLLPQEFTPAARLTAREQLSYYAGLYDRSRAVDGLLAALGLAESADARYEALSGGQKRRVCVGTALVNDPEVLFLDEPTTGIDPAGRRALWETLEDLTAGGTTLLLTTHDMAEAEYLADRVGLLADGRLVAVDSPEGLIAAHGGEQSLRLDLAEAERGECALAKAGYRTSARSGTLVVPGVAPEGIGAVIAELNEADVAYERVEWRQPTLEDAYLRLTGTAVGAEGTPVDAKKRTGVGRGRSAEPTDRTDTDAHGTDDSEDAAPIETDEGRRSELEVTASGEGR
jgi:ABC-2 type transport system ATP-binding protein